jgi:hypothetical protein
MPERYMVLDSYIAKAARRISAGRIFPGRGNSALLKSVAAAGRRYQEYLTLKES